MRGESLQRAERRLTDRNGAIDAFRFVGALGVVWFHLDAPAGWIGHAALPVFVILTIRFGADRTIADRARRLLAPWIAWSAIFAAAKIADALVSGVPIGDEFERWMLLTGPSLHLWFLPFTFLALLLAKAMPDRPGPASLAALAATTALALAAAESRSLQTPVREWVFVTPAAALALAIRGRFEPPILFAAAAAATAATQLLGWEAATPEFALAAASVGLLFLAPAPSTRCTEALGRLALPIYLVHPLVAAFLARLALPEDAYLPATLVGSVAAATALRRFAPAIS